MKKKIIYFLITTSSFAFGQNVAINATGAAPAASAMLDVSSTTSGMLIPRMTSVQRVAIVAPATGLRVYDTTTGGFWFFNGAVWVQEINSGLGWLLAGNTLAGTEFMGSTNAQAVRFFCNNIERMRINPTDGEVVVGAATSGLPGDMLCAVSNAALPWAVNGYSGQNGSGVYGAINAGNGTIFGAVQGEYGGTNNGGTGVRGSYIANGGGLAFTNGNCKSGVNGVASSTGSYKFGNYGYGGTSARSGGVIGNDFNLAFGSLGYLSSGFVDFSVYGFGIAYTTGAAGGKLSSASSQQSELISENNAHIGLGIYGGVMGGWVKGLVYGTNFSGPKYGVYVDGKTISNNIYAQLTSVQNSDKRIATYATTSTEVDVYTKGKSDLKNGKAIVQFSDDFKNLISSEKDVIITITPVGRSNGIFLANVTRDGFEVEENASGVSNISFNWIAIGNKKGFEDTKISEEILDKNYDVNMNAVMHNDNDPSPSLPIWWDGTKVRHDKPLIERKENGTGSPMHREQNSKK